MKKRIIGAGVIFVLVFGLFSAANAADINEDCINEDYSQYTCYCEQTGGMQGANIYICPETEGGQTYSAEHRYDWFANTCTKEVYEVATMVGCANCGYIYGFAGDHECYVIHQDCGFGRESICMIEKKLHVCRAGEQ